VNDHTDPARPARGAAQLEAITSRDPSAPLLLSGAVVVSMDPDIGDLARGDVLVHGTTIVDVGPDLGAHPRAAGAVTVDCDGLILTPGFHDTHRHSWQNQLRRYIPDVDLDGYFTKMHATMAHHYRPHDIYVGNLVSALSSLDNGITTVADISHNSRSAAHTDAAIAAWDDTGIRAVHASSAPFDGVWDEQWPADLDRVVGAMPKSGLVTLRMALFPQTVDLIPDTVAFSRENLEIARRLGIEVSVDAIFGEDASAVIEQRHAEGVLGPDITYIHCTDLTEGAWNALVESGGHVSLAPTSDAQVGMCSGITPIQECLDRGIEPSISIDVECCLAGDMFSNMRAILTIQRMNVFTRRFQGDADAPELVTDRQLLTFATIAGARANGLGDVSGSLTPGKRADLIGIRHDDINVFPLNNAIGTVVQGADARNVELVLVDGEPKKWAGSVLGYDLEEAKRQAIDSRNYLLETAGVQLDVFA
jgi:cytosine/adenosine deaminase-related metal-dependent hydrolase